jgi:hypothetical protein
MSRPIKNLVKYGSVKFDFKKLNDLMHYHRNNVVLRKSSGNPEKVIKLWTGFKETLFEADLIRKRKNDHSRFKPMNDEEKDWHKKQGKFIKSEVEEFEHLLR